MGYIVGEALRTAHRHCAAVQRFWSKHDGNSEQITSSAAWAAVWEPTMKERSERAFDAGWFVSPAGTCEEVYQSVRRAMGGRSPATGLSPSLGAFDEAVNRAAEKGWPEGQSSSAISERTWLVALELGRLADPTILGAWSARGLPST